MAVVALVLWLATAAAGLTMLRAAGARRRAAQQALLAQAVPAQAVPAEAVPVLVRTGALPLQPDGRPPRGPHTRVGTPAGEHPLLEFSHPMLAVAGLGCWLMFTLVHYRAFGWIAVGIMAGTVTLGLGWFFRSRQEAAGWSFPPKLVALHGLGAGLGIVLAVLSALLTAHG